MTRLEETDLTIMIADAQGELTRTLVVTEPIVVLDDVPVGGAITVAFPGSYIGNWGLQTVADVQPPGEVWFGESTKPVRTGMVTLRVPKGAPMGTSEIRLSGPCGFNMRAHPGSPVDVTYSLAESCHPGDTVEAAAVALDSDEIPLAAVAEIDVPLMTGPERIANLVLDSWDTEFGRTEVSYTQGEDPGGIQIDLRPFRRGLAFPVHEPVSGLRYSGMTLNHIAYTEASIHDELQIWIRAFHPLGYSRLYLTHRDLPERGETQRVELTSNDLVPVPEGWALMGDRAFELPVEGWDCDGRSADARSHAPAGGRRRRVALPRGGARS